MILGDSCTRACRFCDVPTGHLNLPDPDEPDKVALSLSRLGLKFAVITSVDRDDLPDGGAGHWVKTIAAIRGRCPEIKIEALIPDFQGDRGLIRQVCEARADVLAHNLETVESLQRQVRPQCRYEWSLRTLRTAAKTSGVIVKSGLMLGLGEKKGGSDSGHEGSCRSRVPNPFDRTISPAYSSSHGGHRVHSSRPFRRI